MTGRRIRRPAALPILLAAALALAACGQEYEAIEVWDPDRPVPPAARQIARASGAAGPVTLPLPRPVAPPASPAIVERQPVDGPVRPPPLPQRRLDQLARPAPAPAASPPPPPQTVPPGPVLPAPILVAPVPAAPAAPPEPAPPPPVAAAARPQVGGTVTVGNGETLFAISRRTGVPVRALIDANGLKPPYGLLTGQRIAVPANRFHEVQPGETLYSVSRRYGVAMSVLVSENGLDAPYGVRAGQRLKVPTPAATSAPETMVAAVPPPNSLQPPPGQILQPPAPQVLRPPPGAEPQPQPQPEPAPPVEPPPQVGFLTPPAITAPEPVLPPQRPGRAAPPAPPPAAEAPPEPTVQPEPAPRPELAPRRGRDRVRPEPPPAVAPVVPPPPPAMAMAPPPEPPPTAGPPPREGRGFAWPVRGQVVTRFGPTGRGLHNDGINIAAPKGAAVLSAEAGIVAYAGNELRGFGNLLLVKHADGWVTAYAHNDSLLVKRGDRIRRGQPIARVGQTGNVGEPQLHFEIRRGTRAVDPAEYLVGRSTELVPELAPPRLRTHPAVLLAALPGPG